MSRDEKHGREFPSCGYGLLGLCCSDCLLGPCRISPFEKETEKGLCGANADLLSAWNLRRLIWREGAQALSSLQRVGGQFQKRANNSGTFGEAVAQLLDPSREIPPSLFSSLFPEKFFPSLYRKTLPSGSLTRELLNLLDLDGEQQEPEKVLWACLRTSLLIFLAEEVEQKAANIENSHALAEELPEAPLPVLITLTGSPGHFQEALKEHILERGRGVPSGTIFIPISKASALSRVGRVLYEKWALTIPDLTVVVLIESISLSAVLGSLALGFTTASYPPLPLKGSERAERFFSEGLKKEAGNCYLPLEDEKAIPMIFQFLDSKRL